MERNKMSGPKNLLLAIIVLFLLNSCDLLSPSPAASTVDSAAVDRAIRETQQAQTIIAFSVQQTVAAGGGGGDVPVLPTFTTQFSLTPSRVTVTVSVNTNCRSGPGDAYPILGALVVGQIAEVVGRSAASDNWIVKLPGKTSTCWLWGYYATIEGDTSSLPVFDPPPTPTPAAGFTVAYSYLMQCPPYYVFRFLLTNTGSITWESFRLDVTDNTTSILKTYTDDIFTDASPACAFIDNLLDLTPGESGGTGNWGSGLFTYNPVGHSITATFKLCSLNGLAGVCVDKTINFTP